jgi:hypothetical protein
MFNTVYVDDQASEIATENMVALDAAIADFTAAANAGYLDSGEVALYLAQITRNFHNAYMVLAESGVINPQTKHRAIPQN